MSVVMVEQMDPLQQLEVEGQLLIHSVGQTEERQHQILDLQLESIQLLLEI